MSTENSSSIEQVGQNWPPASQPEKQEILRDGKGRFVPGVSGNAGGKPSGSVSIVASLRRQLRQALNDGENTVADALAAKLIALGMGKDKRVKAGTSLAAITTAMEHTDGKPIQTLHLEQTIDEETAKRLEELAVLLAVVPPAPERAPWHPPKDAPQLTEGDVYRSPYPVGEAEISLEVMDRVKGLAPGQAERISVTSKPIPLSGETQD